MSAQAKAFRPRNGSELVYCIPGPEASQASGSRALLALIAEAIDPPRVLAEKLALFGLRCTLDAPTQRLKPTLERPGLDANRPGTAKQHPIPAKTGDHMVDVRLQVCPCPMLIICLRSCPGDFTHNVWAPRQCCELL